jgi:hypothetical protein
MTLTELKAVAKEKGLKGYSTLKKEELIKAIMKINKEGIYDKCKFSKRT